MGLHDIHVIYHRMRHVSLKLFMWTMIIIIYVFEYVEGMNILNIIIEQISKSYVLDDVNDALPIYIPRHIKCLHISILKESSSCS